MFHWDKALTDYAKEHPELVKEDYKKLLKEVSQSKAVYKGKPLPFLYYPCVYSQDDIERFETITKDIFKIVNKSIDIYMKYPEVRPVWGFSKTLESLVLISHDYQANVPMGRFDFFYYPDGHYQFCELNTDGTSAMNEETPLTDILLKSEGLKPFLELYQVKRFELYESWVDEVSNIYDEFVKSGHERAEKPYVIIMDFIAKGSPHEFEIFKETFIEKGYDCDIVSPETLSYKEGHLYVKDKKVDIVYRRLVTRDLMEAYEDLQDLVEGIKANKTCFIGSMKTQIVHTKKYFEALHHPLVRKYFSESDLEYIDAHIPFTAPLVKGENYDEYIENKDSYIIKPIDFYASKGVYAGYEHSLEKWKTLLEEGVKEGYIIQKYCKKSQHLNLYFDGNQDLHVKKMNTITGLFVYNEKLKGVFTRASLNGVMSDLNNGYSLSSIVFK